MNWREVRTARGLPGIALQRHVMIAIDGYGPSDYLVRAGARIAERRGAPWSVVTVATGQTAANPRNEKLVGREHQRQREIDKAFALARDLGGTTEILYGTDIAQTLMDAAAARGTRSLVIGRTRERPFARMLNRTLTQRLLQHGAHYELTIIGTPITVKSERSSWTVTMPVWRDLAIVLGATIVASLAAAIAEHLLALEDLSMVFLIGVLLVAARTRMLLAFITASLCFLSYTYFFIEPRFTLLIAAPRGVATVLMFFTGALIAGRLASRLRMQVVALRAANTHATAMQQLGRQLSGAADLNQVITAGASVLQTALQAQVWMRIENASGPVTAVSALDEKASFAADWTQRHGQPSGRYTDTLSDSAWLFLPVSSEKKIAGVVGLRFLQLTHNLSSEQRRLAESMVEDITQAARRVQLVSELEAARVTGETERLRSSLLSSVSHDLRSPLSSMIGSADSLARYGKDMPAEDRQTLLETIRSEGERLDRYIQNLLDMTRLGHEGLTLVRDWIGIDDLIGSATRRLQRFVPASQVQTHIEAELPPIYVHPALIEQAIFNVMENATKFSPAGAAIQVSARRMDDTLRIDVSDSGPGIPEDERHRIFDMFYSVERGDRGSQGTGLGLTIVQGIIGAHMGQVEALPGVDGTGTTIRLTLPWTDKEHNAGN